MDKYLKYVFIVFLLNISSVKSEILKPNKNINPDEVVKIQLKGLMKNDINLKDSGIVQTWEFAHPNNKMFTGPLERLMEMGKGASDYMLLKHNRPEVLAIFKDK